MAFHENSFRKILPFVLFAKNCFVKILRFTVIHFRTQQQQQQQQQQ